MDIELPVPWVRRIGLRQQGLPSLFRHQSQHPIVSVGGFVREVDSCEKLLEQSAGKDGDGNVRRLRNIIEAGDAPAF